MTAIFALRKARVLVCLLLWVVGGMAWLGADGGDANEVEVVAPMTFPERMSIQLEDTHTFVGIAKVHLKIGQMTYEGGKLKGTYSLTVPLKKSNNELGTMQFDLSVPVMSLVDNGGTIFGQGLCARDIEHTRKITCILTPDKALYGTGTALLVVDTGDRVLHFKTRYNCLDLTAGLIGADGASLVASVKGDS